MFAVRTLHPKPQTKDIAEVGVRAASWLTRWGILLCIYRLLEASRYTRKPLGPKMCQIIRVRCLSWDAALVAGAAWL